MTCENKSVILLLGNPNVGKTNLFNSLTKSYKPVGNYPGLTVVFNKSTISLNEFTNVDVIDLPGIYSICPHSEDEALTVNAINNYDKIYEKKIIVIVVDLTNMRKGLYLVSQFIELGEPVIVVFSKYDLFIKKNISINIESLSKKIGVPLFNIDYFDFNSIDKLRISLINILNNYSDFLKKKPMICTVKQSSLSLVELTILDNLYMQIPQYYRYNNKKNISFFKNNIFFSLFSNKLGKISKKNYMKNIHFNKLKLHFSISLINKSIYQRYKRIDFWISKIYSSLNKENNNVNKLTIAIDKIALHPVLGFVLLIFMFGIFFEVLFVWTAPVIDIIEHGQHLLINYIRLWLNKNSLLCSLITDGIISGAGSVLVFTPLLVLLFSFINVLEESGYLARTTCLVNKFMNIIGLSGKSFFPLLTGFCCAVPAILATRIIDSKKARLITILVLPFISCSARLPVYGLLISTTFSKTLLFYNCIPIGVFIIITMYILGFILVIFMAFILKLFLKTDSSSMIIELPSYTMPSLYSVISNTGRKIYIFIKDVGTIILIVTIILWSSFKFPIHRISLSENNNFHLVTQTDLKNTYAGKIGLFVEPIIKPLGFDWKIGIGLIASFTAREVMLSALKVANEMENNYKEKNYIKKKYTPLVALSLMIFFAVAMQCISTLAITRKELNSNFWPILQFFTMTILAWLLSFIFYQIGLFLGFS